LYKERIFYISASLHNVTYETIEGIGKQAVKWFDMLNCFFRQQVSFSKVNDNRKDK